MRNHHSKVPERLLCLDIETVPDRTRLPQGWGEKFPKPIFHQIVAISVLETEIGTDADGCERYSVTRCESVGALGWSEAELLEDFWVGFARRPARVVTWNGRSFDIPVLLQRSLVHGLTAKNWFTSGNRFEGYTHRYCDMLHCDLMDQIADRGACPKLSLDEAARAIDLPGKSGSHGSEVEKMMGEARLNDVRHYCETDVVNLFGLYTRYGLLSGRMSRKGHDAAVASLVGYLASERQTRSHLGKFLDVWAQKVDLASYAAG